MMRIELTRLATHWIFPQHQHEQCHRNGTCHVVLYHVKSLCFLYGSSKFVQNGHFEPISNIKWETGETKLHRKRATNRKL